MVLNRGPQYAVLRARLSVTRAEVVDTLHAVDGVASMLVMDVRSGTDARFSKRKLLKLTFPVLGLLLATSLRGLGS